MRRAVLVSLLALSAAAPPLEPTPVQISHPPTTKYLCVAEQGVGYSFDPASNVWAPGKMDVSEDRFLVQPYDEFKDIARWGYQIHNHLSMPILDYEVNRIGEGAPPMLCGGPASAEWPNIKPLNQMEKAAGAVIECKEEFGTATFSMSVITMAFEEAFEGGFVVNSPDYKDSDTPFIVLGHCAVLND